MNKYIICTGEDQDELMEEVNKAMSKGYVPHGSMTVAYWNIQTPTPGWEYNQPMIHKDAIPATVVLNYDPNAI